MRKTGKNKVTIQECIIILLVSDVEYTHATNYSLSRTRQNTIYLPKGSLMVITNVDDWSSTAKSLDTAVFV